MKKQSLMIVLALFVGAAYGWLVVDTQPTADFSEQLVALQIENDKLVVENENLRRHNMTLTNLANLSETTQPEEQRAIYLSDGSQLLKPASVVNQTCEDKKFSLATPDPEKLFSQESRNEDWAARTEALLLSRWESREYHRGESLDIECRDTICYAKAWFDSQEIQQNNMDILPEVLALSGDVKITSAGTSAGIEIYISRVDGLSNLGRVAGRAK